MQCVAEVPLLKQLYGKYQDRGLTLVGISLDDDETKVKRFVAEKGISWPQLRDGKADGGEVSKLYNVQGTPDIWVINRAGNIVARLWNAKLLDQHLAEVVGGSR